MKTIYTSYLNRSAPWRELNLTRVRVCRWVHNGQQDRYDIALSKLYPTEYQIKNFDQFESEEEWAEAYTREVLDKLDPQAVYDELPDECVLMCHEKPDDSGFVTCHRRLVAKWLEQNIGCNIPEWLSPEQIEKKEQEAKRQQQLDSLLNF